MVKMAVAAGESSMEVFNSMTEFFKMAGISVFSYKTTRYGTFKQLAETSADVFIAPVSYYLLERAKSNIDIMIFLKNSPFPDNGSLNLVSERTIIIVNADDKDIYKYLRGTQANVLTYGFNPKASVTASSIGDSMDKRFIQLCIQRSFKTITGLTVDAQEIPVTFSASAEDAGDALNEIAAITAALAYGINLKAISLVRYPVR